MGRRPANRSGIDRVAIPKHLLEEGKKEALQVVADNQGRMTFEDVLASIWLRGAIQGGLVIETRRNEQAEIDERRY